MQASVWQQCAPAQRHMIGFVLHCANSSQSGISCAFSHSRLCAAVPRSDDPACAAVFEPKDASSAELSSGGPVRTVIALAAAAAALAVLAIAMLACLLARCACRRRRPSAEAHEAADDHDNDGDDAGKRVDTNGHDAHSPALTSVPGSASRRISQYTHSGVLEHSSDELRTGAPVQGPYSLLSATQLHLARSGKKHGGVAGRRRIPAEAQAGHESVPLPDEPLPRANSI